MRLIQKPKRPPKPLTEYAAEPLGTTYDSLPKQAIREALAREQGYLCAYCLSRIKPAGSSMKIDHRNAQRPSNDADPGGAEAALYYRNMLGVCKGGEGLPHDEQHCDTYKANKPLTIDPVDALSGWHTAVYYEAGETLGHERGYRIRSRHAGHDEDLDKTLHLNVRNLSVARWTAIETVVDRICRKHQGAWTRAVLEKEIKHFEQRDDSGRLAPFCEAILFYLRRRLARCTR